MSIKKLCIGKSYILRERNRFRKFRADDVKGILIQETPHFYLFQCNKYKTTISKINIAMNLYAIKEKE